MDGLPEPSIGSERRTPRCHQAALLSRPPLVSGHAKLASRVLRCEMTSCARVDPSLHWHVYSPTGNLCNIGQAALHSYSGMRPIGFRWVIGKLGAPQIQLQSFPLLRL